jgi:hypothetical protein
MGMELENYAFYGVNPTADGRRLEVGNVVERVQRIEGTDTVDVTEGEFQIDTVRVDGTRLWVATRRSTDNNGEPILDSVWLDRFTLRTIKSFRQDSTGSTWLEFNRRAVRSTRITPSGKRETWSGLHTAEPYSNVGIEVVLGALPMRTGQGASLPIVDGRGLQLKWLRMSVLESTPEPMQIAGRVVYSPVTHVKVSVGDEVTHYWVDASTKKVLRRRLASRDGAQILVVRGNKIPKIRLFPVEPLNARNAAFTIRRQGSSSR